ncbi:ganglioside-induced differentiation-associated protein 1-like isoform X1 [Gigantopelta aegis]|uniref:ganglioside-induced differentiation-associated protein 1-like isoform X1 n=1 Tax=Gigantopelta aegis TaxID=1735272 RepID=UPI001B88C77C|nr:ganglioside-induced differentiation-associated protein 1-like isoform X1 [Gigantopelta aegis]
MATSVSDEANGAGNESKAVSNEANAVSNEANAVSNEANAVSNETNSSEIVLYYFPTSFCSQKVLIALKEKNAVFRKRLIDLFELEQMEAWFMRINPRGEVPVLTHGEHVFCDSDSIINYIDKEINPDIKLVPAADTDFGKQIAHFRKLLFDYNIELLTFGTIFHPELMPESVRNACLLRSQTKVKRTTSGPPPVKRCGLLESLGKQCCRKSSEENALLFGVEASLIEFKERALDSLSKLSILADKNADLHERYLSKVCISTEKLNMMQDKEKIEEVLKEMDSIFDVIEEHLGKMKAESGQDTWLCDAQFTAVDISLAVLLGRIWFLGFEPFFFPEERRPYLQAYWKKVQHHKSCWAVICCAREFMVKHFDEKHWSLESDWYKVQMGQFGICW